MRFAMIVDRVRTEFVDVPGLELTMSQAVRLSSLGVDDCRYVIDALDEGFLRWTPKRTIVRNARDDAAGARRVASDVSVGRVPAHDSVVGGA